MDSGHTDQGDLVYYDGYAASFINALFGQSFYKSGGPNHEFQEALTLIWINYLYKIGLHDETFRVDDSERHINQFRAHFDFVDMDPAAQAAKALAGSDGPKGEAAAENAVAAPAANGAAAPETELVQVDKNRMDNAEALEQPSDRNIEADAPLIQQVDSGARPEMAAEAEQAAPRSQHASVDGTAAVQVADNEAKVNGS